MRHQVLCTDCSSLNPRDFNDSTLFWINQQFAVVKVSCLFASSIFLSFGAGNLELQQCCVTS